MNKCCYTALIGNYEELKPPTKISAGWDYICFTDQDIKSDIWQIRKISAGDHPQRRAREIKLQPHIFLPEYEYVLWLDAAFQINLDLNKFWDNYFKSPLTAPAHPIRNCVYMEVKSCLVNRRGDADEVIRQGQAYEKEGIPKLKGIITSGVLMRQMTPDCIDLCNRWWQEVCKHSTRDQIAFAKVSIGFTFHTFRWDYSQSKELKYTKHFKHRH